MSAIDSKECTMCKVVKPMCEFHNNKSRKDGKASACKPCNNSLIKPKTKEQAAKDSKKYALAHPEKRKEFWDSYYKRNKKQLLDKKKIYSAIPEKQKLLKDAYERYKPIARQKRNERRKNPKPHQRVEKSLRDRFRKVIIIMKKGEKVCSWRNLIGCTVHQMKEHIEKQFLDGMGWDNHGNGDGKWNIDHIKPLHSFNLMDIEEQKKAFHYTNCRPLWFIDNMKRSRK